MKSVALMDCTTLAHHYLLRWTLPFQVPTRTSRSSAVCTHLLRVFRRLLCPGATKALAEARAQGLAYVGRNALVAGYGAILRNAPYQFFKTCVLNTPVQAGNTRYYSTLPHKISHRGRAAYKTVSHRAPAFLVINVTVKQIQVDNICWHQDCGSTHGCP